jgi:hypothetical protein
MKKIPVFDAILDDDMDGISAIAIVETPAMEVNWALFNKNDKQKFSIEEEKMVITYPLIVADKPIYRNEPYEHYIKFNKEVIKDIALRFHMDGVNNFNKNHTNDEIKDKMFIFESWLKGKNDKSNDMGFSDISEGSLMVSIQVVDKEYWEKEIKSGNFKGLSMEAFYSMYSDDIKVENFVKNLINSNLDDDVLIKTLQNYIKNN